MFLVVSHPHPRSDTPLGARVSLPKTEGFFFTSRRTPEEKRESLMQPEAKGSAIPGQPASEAPQAESLRKTPKISLIPL